MGCKQCGEKHTTKNHKCGFTPTVIQIENQPEVVFFRKVSIPASMGDETQVPASVGKYRNALVVYEANGNTYIYSSDGIPTKINSGGGSGTDNFDELINRPKYGGNTITSQTNIPNLTGDLEEIDSHIDNVSLVVEALGEDVDSLSSSLSAETAARQEAISELENSLATVAYTGDYNDLINEPETFTPNEWDNFWV